MRWMVVSQGLEKGGLEVQKNPAKSRSVHPIFVSLLEPMLAAGSLAGRLDVWCGGRGKGGALDFASSGKLGQSRFAGSSRFSLPDCWSHGSLGPTS